MNNSVPLPDFRLAVVSSEFAVFENPGGSMAVINQDGTLNKIANPAKPGSVVSIWATGFGATGAPVDGAVAHGGQQLLQQLPTHLEIGPPALPKRCSTLGRRPA